MDELQQQLQLKKLDRDTAKLDKVLDALKAYVRADFIVGYVEDYLKQEDPHDDAPTTV